MGARFSLVSLLVLLTGCPDPRPDDFLYEERFPDPPTCETLFGVPNDKTGLPDGLCMPKVRCDCADTCEGMEWPAPQYFPDDIEELREWTLAPLSNDVSVAPGDRFTPEPLGDDDPYDADPECDTDMDCAAEEACDVPLCRPKGKLCAILPLQEGVGNYVLATYDSEADATAAGGIITHRGPCGLCSTLQDLAVYIEQRDLTDPVRRCGAFGFLDKRQQLNCIIALGFTDACAEIWSFNTSHTGTVCQEVCTAEITSKHNESDGDINPCLACDEIMSGAVFKAFAGRTRRASGLPSAICRPGDAVFPVQHFYPPG